MAIAGPATADDSYSHTRTVNQFTALARFEDYVMRGDSHRRDSPVHKAQRNLLASLALAGTVIAGIAGTAAVTGLSNDAFVKISPQTVATSPFDKWQPTAASVDPYMKFNLS